MCFATGWRTEPGRDASAFDAWAGGVQGEAVEIMVQVEEHRKPTRREVVSEAAHVHHLLLMRGDRHGQPKPREEARTPRANRENDARGGDLLAVCKAHLHDFPVLR